MSLAADQRTRSCATELVCRDCGLRLPLLDTTFKCLGCGQGLDIDYDYELAKARIAERGIGDRPAEARELNIWRFEELLPGGPEANVSDPTHEMMGHLLRRAGFEADRFHIVLMDVATGKKRRLAESWDRSAGALM